jgi:mRNA-degrading endonuclease RelE of RelBE toxin-antitoxin system
MIMSMFTVNLNGQNVAITDDQNYTADSTALLDIKSTNKGVLVPRVTTLQRNEITNPATGLLVYDTDFNKFFYYTGSIWKGIPEGSQAQSTDALFEVKDSLGNTVFAVYEDGVKITVPDSNFTKGKVGGFAISGRSANKASEVDIFKVTPDSTRVYVRNSADGKGNVGGFAVSGRTASKGSGDKYLNVTPANTEIFYDPTLPAKGSVGGFAISGRSATKNTYYRRNVFVSTLDSTRVYINQPAAKGKVGGFAISGRSASKSTVQNFLDLTKENYFIGHESGSNTTEEDKGDKATPYGRFNSFIGYQAGFSNQFGYNNLYLGYQSGYSNQDGHSNVYLGGLTGTDQTQGSQNVFVGYSAGAQNQGTGNIFLGYEAGLQETGSNRLYIDNSDTLHPLIGGDFNQNILDLGATQVRIGFQDQPGSPERLSVNGNIFLAGSILNKKGSKAKPDYVFSENYEKKYTISEVERFIDQNSHLPWVTPDSEEKDSYNLTRMTFETLEATENIQLQVIELKKENEKLRNELEYIKKELKEIKDQSNR